MMSAWIVLPLLLLIHLNSAIASAPSEWNLQPQELVLMKNSGAAESIIESRVEQQRLFLNEKWAQAQLFQFVAKVIPSVEIGYPTWSIASGPETLLKLQDADGYLSTKTRAEVVARQLNRALLIGDGEFVSIHRNGRFVVVFQNATEQFTILSASKRDARISETDANGVAERWATALNHFWRSLPPLLLHPLPSALTLADLVSLEETGIADRVLLAFFQLRDIDRDVKAEELKRIGFSKEVTEYLAKRIVLDSPDGMHRWDYWGSDGYCRSTSIFVTTISFGSYGAFHSGMQRGSSSSSTRGSSVKGSHAGVPGRTSTPHH